MADLEQEWASAASTTPNVNALWNTGKPVAPGPSNASVAINAGNKAIAGIPDMVLNFPSQVNNLIRTLYGKAIGEPAGYSPPPNFAHNAMSSLGYIKPESEPQTGGQHILDSTVQGGVGTAMSPGKGAASLVGNALTGLFGGTVGGLTREATGSNIAALAASLLAPKAVQMAGNAGRNSLAASASSARQNEVNYKTMQDAQAEGYKIPASTLNPTALNKTIETIGGKAAMGQQASLSNQVVTNKLAAKELGFPEDTALTREKLDAYRDAQGAPYRDVAALSPVAKGALEGLQDARHQKRRYQDNVDKTGDPTSAKMVEHFTTREQMFEQAIEKIAIRAGRPDLVAEMKQSRQNIAKSHDIQRALNIGDANVSAPILGRAMDNGKPLTGNLALISRFAEGPGARFTRPGEQVPTPGVSALNIPAGVGQGALVNMATQAPVGWLAAGLPLLRGPARSIALSDWYQKHNLIPTPGLLPRLTSQIPQATPEQLAMQSALLGLTQGRHP